MTTADDIHTLPGTFAGRYLGQLFRSGTAGAANYAEVRGAESRNDFVHKLGVVRKSSMSVMYGFNSWSSARSHQVREPALCVLSVINFAGSSRPAGKQRRQMQS
jgi:hypothetical protein